MTCSWAYQNKISLLPVGHWWFLHTVYFIICFLRATEIWGGHPSPYMLYILCDKDLKQSITHSVVFHFYQWKVISGPIIFTMKGLLWTREAFWKKLVGIINTITYNKRHNLTSPHPTKKFICSFRNSSWKGRAHQRGFFRRGVWAGSCAGCCIPGDLSAHDEYTPLQSPRPSLTLHLGNTQCFLSTDKIQSIGLCLPLIWPGQHRQCWKNNWF